MKSFIEALKRIVSRGLILPRKTNWALIGIIAFLVYLTIAYRIGWPTFGF